ncbi:MAG: hypothetical protein AABX11_00495 [Nanoarchaeota archaeon]
MDDECDLSRAYGFCLPKDLPSRLRKDVPFEEFERGMIESIGAEKKGFLAQGGESKRMVLEGYFPEMDLIDKSR